MDNIENTGANGRASRKLEGIQGMLKFVCVYFIFIIPLLTLARIYFDSPKVFAGVLPVGSLPGLVLTLAQAVCLMIFGILMWKKIPLGLLLAKIFLVAVSVWKAAGDIYAVLNMSEKSMASGPLLAASLVIGLFTPTVLFIYLMVSKRVKNTFLKKPRAGQAVAEAPIDPPPQ
jgi:hypothetical protein